MIKWIINFPFIFLIFQELLITNNGKLTNGDPFCDETIHVIALQVSSLFLAIAQGYHFMQSYTNRPTISHKVNREKIYETKHALP